MEKPWEAKGSSWKIAACCIPLERSLAQWSCSPLSMLGPLLQPQDQDGFSSSPRALGGEGGVQLPGKAGSELVQPVLWSTREANPADVTAPGSHWIGISSGA